MGGTLTVKRIQKARRYYFTSVDDLAKSESGSVDADVPFDNYHHWTGGSEKSMSISDVYEMFTRVSSPTYKELHFFGHATHDGPVIVNTDYYSSKFYDKDPRVADFGNPHLAHVFGAANLVKTRASFHGDPVICIWGCDVNNAALTHIKAVKAKAEKKEPYADEVAKIRTILGHTYASHLAKALGRTVIAALPGMDAVHEGEPNDDKSGHQFHPTAMHVAFSRHEDYMRTYEKYVGVRFATTGAFKGHTKFGRGYAIFDP